ncbi:MAG: EAL domain-containing protein [Candidatus Thiodiazotropha sp.]
MLRWRNPEIGEVSPREFIPIAEHTGLIVPIGQFVVTEALHMAGKLRNEMGLPFTMAVNLSPRQFRDPKLVSFIEKSLKNAGIEGSSLELEITEGVLMSGYAQIEDSLAILSGMNIVIAMDDFGTGYSSLSYLRNYPFDVLKIDRVFVNDITDDPADRELVSAAIAMGHSLGLKVVAEGVETEAQCAILSSQGCDYGQGYLFSKPITPEELEALIAKVNGRLV